MKKKKIIKFAFPMLILILLSFTIIQSELVQQDESAIIGSWVVENEPFNRWEFDESKCRWLLYSEIIGEYNYEITNDFAPNGVEFTILTLTNVNNTSNTIEYTINGIDNSDMMLEYYNGAGIKYIRFTKL